MKPVSRFAATLSILAAQAATATAQDVVTANIRPGWRTADGTHVAALHLKLDAGWKTYWRAPGDAGIPPTFDWAGSDNLSSVSVAWPAPLVSWQDGMRSIVYQTEVVLPLTIRPNGTGDIELRGDVDMGVCQDICIPYSLSFKATLPDTQTRPDPVIAAALASVPFNAAEASVRSVSCDISPTNDGISLTARIDMPSSGGREETVIEVANPNVWVADPETRRNGRHLVATADLLHIDGSAFAVDRSRVRITVLGKRYAVDIQGCS